MKTYKVRQFSCGEYLEIEINVPTPKEFQATTTRDYIQVVITNLTYNDKPQFGVAVYLKKDGAFPLKATFEAMQYFGRNARRDAVDHAAECLVGRY